jgi:hypothetical protein
MEFLTASDGEGQNLERRTVFAPEFRGCCPQQLGYLSQDSNVAEGTFYPCKHGAASTVCLRSKWISVGGHGCEKE